MRPARFALRRWRIILAVRFGARSAWSFWMWAVRSSLSSALISMSCSFFDLTMTGARLAVSASRSSWISGRSRGRFSAFL